MTNSSSKRLFPLVIGALAVIGVTAECTAQSRTFRSSSDSSSHRRLPLPRDGTDDLSKQFRVLQHLQQLVDQRDQVPGQREQQPGQGEQVPEQPQQESGGSQTNDPERERVDPGLLDSLAESLDPEQKEALEDLRGRLGDLQGLSSDDARKVNDGLSRLLEDPQNSEETARQLLEQFHRERTMPRGSDAQNGLPIPNEEFPGTRANDERLPNERPSRRPVDGREGDETERDATVPSSGQPRNSAGPRLDQEKSTNQPRTDGNRNAQQSESQFDDRGSTLPPNQRRGNALPPDFPPPTMRPNTQAPNTQAPNTQAPNTQAPNTLPRNSLPSNTRSEANPSQSVDGDRRLPNDPSVETTNRIPGAAGPSAADDSGSNAAGNASGRSDLGTSDLGTSGSSRSPAMRPSAPSSRGDRATSGAGLSESGRTGDRSLPSQSGGSISSPSNPSSGLNGQSDESRRSERRAGQPESGSATPRTGQPDSQSPQPRTPTRSENRNGVPDRAGGEGARSGAPRGTGQGSAASGQSGDLRAIPNQRVGDGEDNGSSQNGSAADAESVFRELVRSLGIDPNAVTTSDGSTEQQQDSAPRSFQDPFDGIGGGEPRESPPFTEKGNGTVSRPPQGSPGEDLTGQNPAGRNSNGRNSNGQNSNGQATPRNPFESSPSRQPGTSGSPASNGRSPFDESDVRDQLPRSGVAPPPPEPPSLSELLRQTNRDPGSLPPLQLPENSMGDLKELLSDRLDQQRKNRPRPKWMNEIREYIPKDVRDELQRTGVENALEDIVENVRNEARQSSETSEGGGSNSASDNGGSNNVASSTAADPRQNSSSTSTNTSSDVGSRSNRSGANPGTGTNPLESMRDQLAELARSVNSESRGGRTASPSDDQSARQPSGGAFRNSPFDQSQSTRSSRDLAGQTAPNSRSSSSRTSNNRGANNGGSRDQGPSLATQVSDFYKRVTRSGENQGSASGSSAAGAPSGGSASGGGLQGGSGIANGLSWGLSLEFLLAVTVVIVLVVIFWYQRAPLATMVTKPKARLRRIKINCREDVIRAFHLLVNANVAAESWWPHPRAAGAVSLAIPTRQEEVRALAQLYELARYTPEDAELSEEQLRTARRAVETLTP